MNFSPDVQSLSALEETNILYSMFVFQDFLEIDLCSANVLRFTRTSRTMSRRDDKTKTKGNSVAVNAVSDVKKDDTVSMRFAFVLIVCRVLYDVYLK